jgi:hypothetical protein
MPTVNQNAAAILAVLADELPAIREATEAIMPVQTGEWLPTVFGGTTAGTTTYAASLGQVGQYVLQAGKCHFSGRVEWTNATGTGQLRISLPFTAKNVFGLAYYPGVLPVNLSWPTATPPIGLINPNTNYMVLTCPTNNGNHSPVQMDTSATIVFGGWYFVQ